MFSLKFCQILLHYISHGFYRAFLRNLKRQLSQPLSILCTRGRAEERTPSQFVVGLKQASKSLASAVCRVKCCIPALSKDSVHSTGQALLPVLFSSRKESDCRKKQLWLLEYIGKCTHSYSECLLQFFSTVKINTFSSSDSFLGHLGIWINIL